MTKASSQVTAPTNKNASSVTPQTAAPVKQPPIAPTQMVQKPIEGEGKKSWFSSWVKKSEEAVRPLDNTSPAQTRPTSKPTAVQNPVVSTPTEKPLLDIKLEATPHQATESPIITPDLVTPLPDALYDETVLQNSDALTDSIIDEAASLLEEAEAESSADLGEPNVTDTINQEDNEQAEEVFSSPHIIAPAVVEFGDDESLLEQQLDAMLGEDIIEVRAVKDEIKPIIPTVPELDLEFHFSEEEEEEELEAQELAPETDSSELNTSETEKNSKEVLLAAAPAVSITEESQSDEVDIDQFEEEEADVGESEPYAAEEVSDEELEKLLAELGGSEDSIASSDENVPSASSFDSIVDADTPKNDPAVETAAVPLLSTDISSVIDKPPQVDTAQEMAPTVASVKNAVHSLNGPSYYEVEEVSETDISDLLNSLEHSSKDTESEIEQTSQNDFHSSEVTPEAALEPITAMSCPSETSGTGAHTEQAIEIATPVVLPMIVTPTTEEELPEPELPTVPDISIQITTTAVDHSHNDVHKCETPPPQTPDPVSVVIPLDVVGADESIHSWQPETRSLDEINDVTPPAPRITSSELPELIIDSALFEGMIINSSRFVDEVSTLLSEAYGLNREKKDKQTTGSPITTAQGISDGTENSTSGVSDSLLADSFRSATMEDQVSLPSFTRPDSSHREARAAHPLSPQIPSLGSVGPISENTEEIATPTPPAIVSQTSGETSKAEITPAPVSVPSDHSTVFDDSIWNSLQMEIQRHISESAELDISSAEIWDHEPSPKIDVLFDLLVDEAKEPERKRSFVEKLSTAESVKIDNQELTKEFKKLEKQALAQAAKEEQVAVGSPRTRRTSGRSTALAAELEEWAVAVVPASLPRRVIAKIIDIGVALAVACAIAVMSYLPIDVLIDLASPHAVSLDLLLPVAAKSIALIIAVHVVLSTVLIAGRGKTVGKGFVKIAVVRIDGFPTALRESFLRALLELTTATTLGLGLLPLARRSRRSLHDNLSDTIVTKDDY